MWRGMSMARKHDKNKPSTIVTIDHYQGKSYIVKDGTLSPLKKLSYKRQYFFATYLANKDMIIAPVEVSVGLDEADLDGLLEDRAYEELGLDPAQEYIIHHHEIASDDTSKKVYQLFVVDHAKYTEMFGPLREQIKYIDLIVPAPLLYRSLYTMNALEPKGVHAFLYFGTYDTFVTFYKNGHYLYSKSINYSLEQIYDRYCEMVGSAVDKTAFFKTLKKDGLKTLQSEYQQNLMKLFGEIFISVNDIIIYTKRAYELDVIDQMFIGSDFGTIVGLDEYVQNYLGLHATALAFDLDFRTDEWHTDQIQYMLAASAFEYIEAPEGQINFTLYPKPPTFFKRPSGQIVAMLTAALLAAFAMPIYYYVRASLNDVQTYKINQEEKVLAKEVAKYKRLLKEKKEEYDHISAVVKELSERFVAKEKTLRAIYDKKVHYRLKSDQLASFSADLDAAGVRTNALASDHNHFRLSLISPSDIKITRLIKAISDKYYDDIRSIDIEMIHKDENSTFYQGILKVDLE
jgi:hypothetical protein